MEIDGKESDRLHRSFCDFLVSLVIFSLSAQYGDKWREERQEVVVTTPWPPGSLGLR